MTIGLKNKRNGILRIDIKLWMPHIQDYAKAEAIFDTGAAKTVLDEKLADLLQLPLKSDRRATTITASGAVDAFTSILPPKYFIDNYSVALASAVCLDEQPTLIKEVFP